MEQAQLHKQPQNPPPEDLPELEYEKSDEVIQKAAEMLGKIAEVLD